MSNNVNNLDHTVEFNSTKEEYDVKSIFFSVYDSLKEKGYNPVNQIIGYLSSGDPTYITNYRDARNLIQKIERDELMEALIRFYLSNAR